VAKASPKTNVTVNPTEEELASNAGKGRPTPSRREREAANRRPLVGGTPADKKAARARLTSERERARVGMANGEEKYLQPRDRGEQRRFVRDHIDARWNVGEALIPFMVIVLIVSSFGGAASSVTLVLIWVFVAVFALDVFVTHIVLKKKLTRKFGSVQDRTLFYIVNRSFMLRFMRLPKPQVRRGQYPE
jgi:uncharacterized MAPEG superfamily protein